MSDLPFPFRTDPTRDWPEDFGHENGNYLCICCHCKEQFVGHKRRVVCKACYNEQEAALDSSIKASVETETSCRVCGSGNHLSDGHTYALTGSDQKQMPRYNEYIGLSNKQANERYKKVAIQANLCADYHAAVEKVLAEVNALEGSRALAVALSELSAVHEKAKGLL